MKLDLKGQRADDDYAIRASACSMVWPKVVIRPLLTDSYTCTATYTAPFRLVMISDKQLTRHHSY